jgi:hypothetical protein
MVLGSEASASGTLSAIHVYVDPSYPNVWRNSPYYERLKSMSAMWPIFVRIGKRNLLVVPDKDIERQFGEQFIWFIDRAARVMHVSVLPEQKAEALRGVARPELLKSMRQGLYHAVQLGGN